MTVCAGCPHLPRDVPLLVFTRRVRVRRNPTVTYLTIPAELAHCLTAGREVEVRISEMI